MGKEITTRGGKDGETGTKKKADQLFSNASNQLLRAMEQAKEGQRRQKLEKQANLLVAGLRAEIRIEKMIGLAKNQKQGVGPGEKERYEEATATEDREIS